MIWNVVVIIFIETLQVGISEIFMSLFCAYELLYTPPRNQPFATIKGEIYRLSYARIALYNFEKLQ